VVIIFIGLSFLFEPLDWGITGFSIMRDIATGRVGWGTAFDAATMFLPGSWSWADEAVEAGRLANKADDAGIPNSISASSPRSLGTNVPELDQKVYGTPIYFDWAERIRLDYGVRIIEEPGFGSAGYSWHPSMYLYSVNNSPAMVIDPKAFDMITLLHETRHLEQIKRLEMSGIDVAALNSTQRRIILNWMEVGAYNFERQIALYFQSKGVVIPVEYLNYLDSQQAHYWNIQTVKKIVPNSSAYPLLPIIEPDMPLDEWLRIGRETEEYRYAE
jgi:hypothetical protein